MSVENFGSSVNWDFLQDLVQQKIPVSQWTDESTGDFISGLPTNAGFVKYVSSMDLSFTYLYDALREELPASQRENCDRLYAMFHWGAADVVSSGVPGGLRRRVRDLEVIDDVGEVTGLLSPESVEEAVGYAQSIDFDAIQQLLNSLYPNPEEWQRANSPNKNKTKSETNANGWSNQSALIQFHRFNCFYNAAEAIEYAKMWVDPLLHTAKASDGFLTTVSF